MIIVMAHSNTKSMREAYNRFRERGVKNIADCYQKPSYRKMDAYFDCLETAKRYSSGYYGITAYNIQKFTFCFIGKKFGKCIFARITRDKAEYIYLDEVTENAKK